MLAQYEAGKQVVAQSGCLACHKIGENGNGGPGPTLTEIGARLPAPGDRAHADQPDGADAVVRRACRRTQPEKFDALVTFLVAARRAEQPP